MTDITPVVNTIIEKTQEIAKDQMVTTSLKQYNSIDFVKITEIFNIIAVATRDLCVQIGVPSSLAPTQYNNIDYNGITAAMGYLGDSLNVIIDELQSMTQFEPYKGWTQEGRIN